MKLKGTLTILSKLHGFTLVHEYQFDPSRKWRADHYIPELNVLIEYEGMGRGKYGTLGGHQTINGYSANCEKYNRASLLGFRLLRYTALNYNQVHDDLKYLLNL